MLATNAGIGVRYGVLDRQVFATGLIDCLSSNHWRVSLSLRPFEQLAASQLGGNASGEDIVCAIETTLAFVSFIARGGIRDSDPLKTSWPVLESFIELLVSRLEHQAESDLTRGADLKRAWQKIRRQNLGTAPNQTGAAGLTPKTSLGSIGLSRGSRDR